MHKNKSYIQLTGEKIIKDDLGNPNTQTSLVKQQSAETPNA
jgi:hypothetical protein